MAGRKMRTTIEFVNGKQKIITANIRDTAKAIIETIFIADKNNGEKEFSRLEELFIKNEKNIGIDISELGLERSDLLSFVFLTQESENYSDSPRCFHNSTYDVPIKSSGIVMPKCKLSNQWRNATYEQSGNYLWALIKIVNKRYSGFLNMKSEFENKNF